MPFVKILSILRNNQSQMLNEKRLRFSNVLRATGFTIHDNAGVVSIFSPLDILTLPQET